MRICPKCSGILDENTYFNQWICTKRYCDYREEIKNSQWIDELTLINNGNTLRLPDDIDLRNKVNEIIKVLNQTTNPRVKGL